MSYFDRYVEAKKLMDSGKHVNMKYEDFMDHVRGLGVPESEVTEHTDNLLSAIKIRQSYKLDPTGSDWNIDNPNKL